MGIVYCTVYEFISWKCIKKRKNLIFLTFTYVLLFLLNSKHNFLFYKPFYTITSLFPSRIYWSTFQSWKQSLLNKRLCSLTRIRNTEQSAATHMHMSWHNTVFERTHPHTHTGKACGVVLLQWPSHVVRKTSLELLHLLTRSTAARCARTCSTLSDKLWCTACQSDVYMHL